MRHVRWVPVLAVVSLIVATTAARATLWRLTCIDGNPQAVVKVPGEPPQPADWVTCDGIRDGVCTFSVERQVCGCPGRGCCGYDTFTVSAGRSQVVRDTPGFPHLRLRCRRCPGPPLSSDETGCSVAPTR